MSDIELKQGEEKTLKFAVSDNGAVVDCSDATFYFCVKAEKEAVSPILEYQDAAFDKQDAATGIVRLIIDTSSLTPGTYYAELKTIFTSSHTDKSQDIRVKIRQAVSG